MSFSRRGTKPLRILFTLLIGCLFSAQPLLQSHAQSMASATRSDEVDTADRQGGQIGGARMGIHYHLVTMRCGSGEVMVGLNIRRRDALNYMQIACATPLVPQHFVHLVIAALGNVGRKRCRRRRSSGDDVQLQ